MKIYRSKDVPWRVKCKRMVEQVYGVFCFESANWSWRQAILDRIKGWGNKGHEASVQIFCEKKRMRTSQDIVKGRQEQQERSAQR